MSVIIYGLSHAYYKNHHSASIWFSFRHLPQHDLLCLMCPLFLSHQHEQTTNFNKTGKSSIIWAAVTRPLLSKSFFLFNRMEIGFYSSQNIFLLASSYEYKQLGLQFTVYKWWSFIAHKEKQTTCLNVMPKNNDSQTKRNQVRVF